jgi:2-C-methyl-D-erythritol 4-phosphate cytidylyltransferase/2-C-methyl-D-erythritol 2,4-cyclodiphosphate synthase
MTRVGWGHDVHRFDGPGPLALCGVEIESSRGLLGTSDADVALHAVIDAVLGAAALGDLGEHFPPSDSRWEGASSRDLLARVRNLVEESGYLVTGVDVTIVAETVRISPHRARMSATLAELLGLELGSVSVKATSTDGLGFVGRDEGMAATAVATLTEKNRQS